MIKLCAFADEADSNIYGQIKALKKNGIGLMELRSIDGKNIKDISISEAENYANLLADNQITVWSIGSPLGKVDISVNFTEYQKTVEHICRLANIFKSKKIRIFSFFNAYDNGQKVFDYLNRMVAIAEKYQVELCHENEKEVYGDTIERVLEIEKNVKGIKLIFDPANYIQVGETADNALNALHNKTDYFHIKDVIKSTEELVPAGHGDCKIDKLIEMIDEDKVFTLEPHLAVFDGFKDIDNTQLKNKYNFESNAAAFDAAVSALKLLLKNAGYIQVEGGFIKS